MVNVGLAQRLLKGAKSVNNSRHGKLRLQRKGRERVSMLLKLLIEGQSVEMKGGKGEGVVVKSGRIRIIATKHGCCANIS